MTSISTPSTTIYYLEILPRNVFENLEFMHMGDISYDRTKLVVSTPSREKWDRQSQSNKNFTKLFGFRVNNLGARGPFKFHFETLFGNTNAKITHFIPFF